MKDFLHHLFIPRESNNHRAKLLHHQSLFYVLIFMLSLLVLIPPLKHDYPSILGISTNIAVVDLLRLTNQQRVEKGLAPLKMNDQLAKAADEKAKYMFEKNFWAHVAPDGTTPWVFIKNSGYEYLYAGENLARGFTSASDVVNAWMASPSHRDNMLSPNYNDIGFAVEPGTLTGSETILVVEMFGKKYIADDTSQTDTSGSIALAVSPTGSVPSFSPTPIPPTEVISAVPKHMASAVAAVSNQPLIDSKSFTKQISYGLLILFIIVLIIDAIVIERKKIVRVVSHNLDHIIFLIIILLAAILIGRGLVL